MKIVLNSVHWVTVLCNWQSCWISTNYPQLGRTALSGPGQVPGTAAEPAAVRLVHALDHQVPASCNTTLRPCHDGYYTSEIF